MSAGRISGRVEHVRSAQAKHFWSLDELLDFITQILTTFHGQSRD